MLETVSISYDASQLGAASLLEQACKTVNAFRGTVGQSAAELVHLGSVALNQYYEAYGLRLFVDERGFKVPTDQLTLDVLLRVNAHEADGIRDQILKEARALARQRAKPRKLQFPSGEDALAVWCLRPSVERSHQPGDPLVLHRAHFENFVVPNVTDLPRFRSYGSAFSCATPAFFLIHTILRIRSETVMEIDTENLAQKRIHRNRRYAQVFLVRLFRKLVQEGDSRNLKEALDWRLLEDALPRPYIGATFKVYVSNWEIERLAEDAEQWHLEHFGPTTDGHARRDLFRSYNEALEGVYSLICGHSRAYIARSRQHALQ